MGLSTYSQFQNLTASEKIGLAIVEAAKEIVGWTNHAGNVYKVTSFSYSVLQSVKDDGTALTSVDALGSIGSGKYYHDSTNSTLYVQLSDDGDPTAGFMGIVYRLFFSNVAINAPHDLSTGFDVHWEPLLKDTSEFSLEIDNKKTNLGVAISGKASMSLYNDSTFWGPLYDNVVFENQRVYIYSYNRNLPITEAKLVYQGRTIKRAFSESSVRLNLQDLLEGLRAPVELSDMDEHGTAIIPDSLNKAKQRRLYGHVNGTRPTPIDQVLSTGYTTTGTVSITTTTTALTGAGTSFLAELTPGDSLFIGTDTTKVAIEEVTDDTNIVLADTYTGTTKAGVSCTVEPFHAKRWLNRKFLVAGHALARPSTTITSIIDNASFYLADTSFLFEDDEIEVNGGKGTIRVLGDGFVKLDAAIAVSIAVTDTVYKSSVSSVSIDQDELTLTTDYTYDASTAIITLLDTAEFNIAPVKTINGSDVAIVNGNRTLVGTATTFMSDLVPGDWIRKTGTSNWYEVLQITDDTHLIVRTTPGTTENGAPEVRKPNIYDEGQTVLSCNALGKTDGSGNFLMYPGSIAADLLSDAGLSDDLNSASFSTADDLIPYRIGISIPAQYSSKKTPSVRSIINSICRSSFCSLIHNNSFQLEMTILDPSNTGTTTRLDKTDVLSWTVNSDSKDIIKSSTIRYNIQEYNAAAGDGSEQSKTENNEYGKYLANSEKTFNLDTLLIDEDDAITMSSRWAFLFSQASSDVTIRTALQTSDLNINDIISLDLDKLFQRFGSTDTGKLGAIVLLKKSLFGVQLKISDFGNAFTRCARVADTATNDYDSATSEEQLLYGFITDSEGLISGSASGLNLIW